MGPVTIAKCSFQIGDILELITSEGSDFGHRGDHLQVTEMCVKDDWRTHGGEVLVTGILLDGAHKGTKCGRFAKRYKLHSKREWD